MPIVRLLALASLLVFTSLAGLAQTPYPARPVRIVVAFTAGSATDILARVTADYLAKSMGQPFIVENKPGAGGSVGTAYAKNAPADGYTLVAAGSGPFGVNPGVYTHLAYDPLQDFEPIGNIALTPQAFVVRADSPYRSLKDLIAAARARPGEIAYASLGIPERSPSRPWAIRASTSASSSPPRWRSGRRSRRRAARSWTERLPGE